MNDVLLRDVEVDGARVEVLVTDGRIAAIGDGVEAPMGARVVEGHGGALLPGLHDHHVHLLAMASRRDGIDVDRVDTAGGFDDAVRGAQPGPTGWVRVTGHDEHRHGELDRHRLDRLVGTTKVRVQHRSGLAWTLSSPALAALGIDGTTTPDDGIDDAVAGRIERDGTGAPTGRLLRLDDWLSRRIGLRPPSLDAIGAELASFGITGVTDATPGLGIGRLEVLLDAVGSGALPQRLVLLGVDDEDLRGRAVAGPAKLLADEVLGLDPEALASAIAAHHARGRAVAIHAVSRAETVTAVTALALAGPLEGDRIEHGSVLPTDLDPVLADACVTVVVQPALVAERGDHHRVAVDGEDLPFLHRLASLRAAGVPLAIGSDAPVTSADPWAAIRAAVDRTTRSGAVVGAAEAITAGEALDLFLVDPLMPTSAPRRVRVGRPADLVLLDRPLAAALAAPDARHVRHTWVEGRLVHP